MSSQPEPSTKPPWTRTIVFAGESDIPGIIISFLCVYVCLVKIKQRKCAPFVDSTASPFRYRACQADNHMNQGKCFHGVHFAFGRHFFLIARSAVPSGDDEGFARNPGRVSGGKEK